MKEVNMLAKLPRGKRNVNARAEAKTDETEHVCGVALVKDRRGEPGHPACLLEDIRCVRVSPA